MAVVLLDDALSDLAGGETELEFEARTVGELIQQIEMDYPRLGAEVASGMDIVIDGEVLDDPLSEPLEIDSEVRFQAPA